MSRLSQKTAASGKKIVSSLSRQLRALRKKHESSLHEIAQWKNAAQNQQLQLEVLNNIPAVAWTVTPDGRCDFINQYYLDVTGLSAEECMARPETWRQSPDDLPPFLSILHPGHRERAAKIFWGGIRSGQGWAFEAPFLHADGLYHWHFDRAVPLRDAGGKISRFVGTCADIEELRVAQQSLRTSERLLQTIIDNSPSVIFIKDTEGRYLLVNKQFEAIARKSREQIIGRFDEDVFPPAEAAAFRTNDREVLSAGIPLQFEESVLTDRGTVWSVVEKFPLFDGNRTIFATCGIATDISDRKKALQQLEIAQQKSRLIFDTALDAIVTIDSAGRITDWNKQAEKIFGWPKAEIYGQKLSDTIIPQSLRMDHEIGLKNFLATGYGSILNRRVEVTALHRDGFEFPVELTVAPVRIGSEWTFTAFIRDLTERQATEEALRIAQDELARVSRLTAMGQLSAAIAHEINQPLTAVVTNGETCLRWLSNGERNLEKAAAAAQRMARDARHAAEIVAHIRSLMNKTSPEKNPLDINTLIKNVLDLTQSEMFRQQVSVQSKLTDAIPTILGDRIQLQQVILNLILNSIEAMAVVHDRPRTLVIKSIFNHPNCITVTFQDSGTGIDPAVIDRIFDSFFTTKTNGTGMGLSICRSIIEAHNGELSAMPGVPYGAVFQFNLPSVTTIDLS